MGALIIYTISFVCAFIVASNIDEMPLWIPFIPTLNTLIAIVFIFMVIYKSLRFLVKWLSRRCQYEFIRTFLNE